MFKKIQFWAPLFVLASIALDTYINWADVGFRTMAITASLGWLFYWDALNDLRKYEKDAETNAQS
jgi:hypothetical protein